MGQKIAGQLGKAGKLNNIAIAKKPIPPDARMLEIAQNRQLLSQGGTCTD
jgi:hypothetical protein